MTTQNATPAFEQNLEKLCSIIEESFGIGRLTITDQSAMCDFSANERAIQKVSAAVGFEVKDTDYLFDIAERMTGAAPAKDRNRNNGDKRMMTIKRLREDFLDGFPDDWQVVFTDENGNVKIVKSAANRDGLAVAFFQLSSE